MDCPYCKNAKSKVTNKRASPEGIRRRRECLKCKKRFTTYEKHSEHNLWIIKKDKKREKFDREKLMRGLEKAFEKRPIPRDKVHQLAVEIEEQLKKKGKREVKSSVVGEMVMKKIRKLDNVAYIRFASVYRDFQDVQDFKREIKELK